MVALSSFAPSDPYSAMNAPADGSSPTAGSTADAIQGTSSSLSLDSAREDARKILDPGNVISSGPTASIADSPAAATLNQFATSLQGQRALYSTAPGALQPGAAPMIGTYGLQQPAAPAQPTAYQAMAGGAAGGSASPVVDDPNNYMGTGKPYDPNANYPVFGPGDAVGGARPTPTPTADYVAPGSAGDRATQGILAATTGPSIYGSGAAAAYNAPAVRAAAPISAQAIDPGSLGTAGAGNISAQQIAAPGGIVPNKIGYTPQAYAQMIDPQRLDATQANQSRASQQQALGLVAGAANGTAPSAAEALLRKGIDENVGAQLGLAGTLQGNNPGAALRAGLAGAQGAIAKSAADMAALRAQEQATGRQQFIDASGAVRQQDIGTAAANLNAGVDIAKANQGANLAGQQTSVAAALDVAKSNQAAQMQAQIVTLQASLDTAKANQQAALSAGQSNQAAQLQASIQNMETQLGVAKQNQAAALTASQANQQTDLANATQQASLDAAAAQYNAGAQNDMTKFGATQQLSAAQSNQDAAIKQELLNANQYMGLTQLQLQANKAPYDALLAQMQLDANAKAANQTFLGGLLSTGAKAAAS